MKFSKSVMAVVLSLVVLGSLCDRATAQIVYQDNSFESIAIAETDAGPEYTYSINRADKANANGTYTYIEEGSAPGYSSSASVGVEHDSVIGPAGFHLTGAAHGYVADDYGYAACSANAESLVSITFTLKRARRISISGSLGLSGSSAPEAYSNYFELRRSNGSIVKSSSGVGSISYSGRLTAGTYTVYVSSQVLRAIDFSGGDVYENSTASFDVKLAVR